MSGQGVTGGSTTANGLIPVVASTAADLLPAFLEWVAAAPPDPFEPQVVVVPNIGMAEYLEAGIRAAHGICANVEFVFPGRLRERAGVASLWPWSVEEATWMVLHALDDPALAEQCGLSARLEERPLAVARHVAELFDRYHSYRPGLVQAWLQGEFVDDLGGAPLPERFRWQYDVLRAIDRANERPGVAPRRLPGRIALFGAGAPVGAQGDLVRTLADDLEVTAFLLVPGPLPAALERWASPAVAALAFFTDDGGSRPSAPPALPDLELHLCYGPSREFDAARDAILDHFARDEQLSARDITVLVPAIARTAPLAAPILGAPLAGDSPEAPRRLPVRIADRVPSLAPSVTVAIDAVLGLAAGRCRATEVLAVLRLEPVAAAFGLTPEAAERVSAWVIDGLDVRWGLDAEHRGRWGYAPELSVGAWAPAVDRLLAGLLIQNPGGSSWTTDERVEVLVPFDDISGSEFALVGIVGEFVHALREFASQVEHNPTMAEWADLLDQLLTRFIADTPATRREINAAREFITSIRDRAAAILRPVGIGEFRTLLATAFDDRAGSARNRFDAITISGPRARRGVPHRVTAIVGLDDDATRGAAASGDDVLAETGADRPWEADRAAETRLAVLDALLASERVVVTSTARDIVTNRDLGTPVVIEELADAFPALRNGLDDPERQEVLRHHRRLADDRTYDPAGPAWAAALEHANPPGTVVIDAETEREPLVLADLTAPYLRAQDLFLRSFDAALPPTADDREEEVDLAIGRLQDSILANRLIAHLAAEGSFEDWILATKAGGSLPPLRLGDLALDGLVRDVAELLDLALGNGPWPRAGDKDGITQEQIDAQVPMRLAAVEQGYRVERVRTRVDVDHAGGPTAIDTEIDVVGDTVVRVHHGELHGRHLIEPWAALALLASAHPGRAWTARVAGYRKSNPKVNGKKTTVLVPVVRTLTLTGTGAADTVLGHLLALRTLARTTPIPVFRSATTENALGKVGDRGVGWGIRPGAPEELSDSFSDVQSDLSYDLERGATAWFFGGVTAADLAALTLSDPERAVLQPVDTDPPGAALAYVRHLHRAFTSTATISKFDRGAP